MPPALNNAPTCLATLLRASTKPERALLAEMAGTTVNYLYSMAGCHRERVNVKLALAIEDASRILNKQTKGRTPVVTARDLSTMCDLSGFQG